MPSPATPLIAPIICAMPNIVASDIVSFSHCKRRLWYDYNPPADIEPSEPDPFDVLIQDLGLAHEQSVLERLGRGAELEEANSVEHTQDLMADKTPVIYQAQLRDQTNGLFGKPDFLILQDGGTYQAADAKLSRSLKKEIGIQIAFYRRLLGNDLPGIAYLGDGETKAVGDKFDVPLDDFISEAQQVLSEAGPPVVLYGNSKCLACPYYPICEPAFQAAEELSLLYGLDSRSVPGLQAHGITTISDLAVADPDSIPDIPYLKGGQKQRAVMQARAWKTGEIAKLNDILLPEGAWVHFDIEANPQTPDGFQHVYLWGFLKPPYGLDDFEYVWTDRVEDDRDGWLRFLDLVDAYRARWPDLKLVHFASFERDQIRAYAKRYGMEDHPTVTWLLDAAKGPLYDIRKAVTQNLVLPLPGYGLKNICKHPDLVNFQWENDESGSQWSVVQYFEFLNSDNDEKKLALKYDILTYNRDDVRATRALEEWLRRL